MISIPDISNWFIIITSHNKIIKETNSFFLNFIFGGCSSLISLPNISKWNINNVNSMGTLFYKCSSLIKLPDISKWNMSNVTKMNKFFFDVHH